jgi:hypothetical protein
LVDSVCEVGHRVELQIEGPLCGGFRGRSPAGAVVAAVDPDRRQTFPLGRDVIVEQALRDMQQPTAIHAEAGERGVEGAEVFFGGLVGADVLGGDDGGEVAAQPLVAGGEAGPVDVGEDDQLVVLGQPGQRIGGVGERRPVRNRVAQPLRPRVAYRRA